MLQFILGRAVTGKSSKILELIKKDLEEKRDKIIFIVPEQFSFETERMLLSEFSESGSINIKVMSFSRLFDEISRIAGGFAGERLCDSDRIVIMGRTLRKEKDNLEFFKKCAESQEFAEIISQTVYELKNAAVSSNKLTEIANSDNISSRTQKKLRDLAHIMDCYKAELHNKFIDPTDDMDKLSEMVKNTDYFCNSSVYFDGFYDFSGQQFMIIKNIIAKAKSVRMALCYDEKSTDIFGVTDAVIKKISGYCKENKVSVEAPILLGKDGGYYNNESIAQIEKHWGNFQEINNAENSINGLKICCADSIDDEADYAVYIAKKTVRENPEYKYRDFAVIARSEENYKRAICRAAQKYGVPVTVDTRTACIDLPVFRFALCALQTVGSFSMRNVLRYLKTGMTGIEFDDITKLENYIIIWNINGNKFTENWNMNPDGLAEIRSKDEERVNAELLKINELREQLINPLVKLNSAVKSGKSSDIAKAVWSLMMQCNIKETLEKTACDFETDGCPDEADITRQSYKAFCSVLDRTLKSLDLECTAKSFYNAFKLAAGETTLGTIPQKLDSVIFGSVDRIRVKRPKAVIALGLNSGEWPQCIKNTGILSAKDRLTLKNSGISITDYDEDFLRLEDFLCYTALTSPTDCLHLVYHSHMSGETPCSYIVNDIKNAFCNAENVNWPQNTDSIDKIESEYQAFSTYAQQKMNKTPITDVLERYFSEKPEWKGKLSALDRAVNEADFALSREVVDKVIPKRLSMSASATEKYNNCKFSYFCNYILGASKTQKADFNAAQTGTFIHKILERLVTDLKDDLGNADDDTVFCLIDKYYDEYIDGFSGLKESLDSRSEYQLSVMKIQAKLVALRLRDEFAQNEFLPDACELRIGDGQEIAPLEFESDGITLVTNGTVDRVDTCGKYLRVVDYKTGSKAFRLSDILVGQNMQMLLYLYTLSKSDKYKDFDPCAVLYMIAKISDNEDNSLKMTGLIEEDIELVMKMEEENKGKFIPPLLYNSSGSINKRSSANYYIQKSEWKTVFSQIDKIMKNMAKCLANGEISARPTDCGKKGCACDYCDYSSVCGITDDKRTVFEKKENSKVLEEIKTGGNN